MQIPNDIIVTIKRNLHLLFLSLSIDRSTDVRFLVMFVIIETKTCLSIAGLNNDLMV